MNKFLNPNFNVAAVTGNSAAGSATAAADAYAAGKTEADIAYAERLGELKASRTQQEQRNRALREQRSKDLEPHGDKHTSTRRALRRAPVKSAKERAKEKLAKAEGAFRRRAAEPVSATTPMAQKDAAKGDARE